jgi:hypothetical protein
MKIVLTNRPEETEEDQAAVRNPNLNNQKLGLLAALLRAGAWTLADQILNILPRAYCVSQVLLLHMLRNVDTSRFLIKSSKCIICNRNPT